MAGSLVLQHADVSVDYALSRLWSWMSFCWLLRSLQHSGSHQPRWYGCSDAFYKLDSTRARVAVSLHDAHAVCDHVAAGP